MKKRSMKASAQQGKRQIDGCKPLRTWLPDLPGEYRMARFDLPEGSRKLDDGLWELPDGDLVTVFG